MILQSHKDLGMKHDILLDLVRGNESRGTVLCKHGEHVRRCEGKSNEEQTCNRSAIELQQEEV